MACAFHYRIAYPTHSLRGKLEKSASDLPNDFVDPLCGIMNATIGSLDTVRGAVGG